MVTKVIGKVDGQQVIYEREEGDKWIVTVPFDLDGMYVIEVTAYDEAGNIAYCTKMLLIVDPATLCVSLVPYEYTVEVVPDNYMIDVVYPNHGRCCCE
ncbi:PF13754 domain-containing protein [Dorea formicigenerans]|uniref:PF13754 domain-containing protein n=1 Tax=Dorea formicigenerans TaxID=39486 RepID=UPI001D02093C|nr:PF13754 domain-containing protein [Dorea formicigenerans]MCB5501985.1 Ig-like domain repeat protein [Dorea formicigenerans]